MTVPFITVSSDLLHLYPNVMIFFSCFQQGKKGGKKGKKKPLSKREMEQKKREKEKLEQEAAAREQAEAIARQRKHEAEMAARAVHLLETAETISFYDKVVFAYMQHQKRLRGKNGFHANAC